MTYAGALIQFPPSFEFISRSFLGKKHLFRSKQHQQQASNV
jgi:hypothetical protein